MTGTRTVQDRSVSIELLLGFCRISRADTGAVMNSILSVGLVLGQKCAVGYQ